MNHSETSRSLQGGLIRFCTDNGCHEQSTGRARLSKKTFQMIEVGAATGWSGVGCSLK